MTLKLLLGNATITDRVDQLGQGINMKRHLFTDKYRLSCENKKTFENPN